MKKLLSSLIALQLSVVFVGLMAFEDVRAQDSASPPPATASPPGSEVLVAPGSASCGPVTPGTAPIFNADDIVVLLTEGIERGADEGWSCGEIIQCLRTHYGKNKQTADAMVMADLSGKYWHCVVSGKDGLGLLNNYAGLVYRWIAGLVGAVCILMIILSGIQISMGGLSQEEVSAAKDRIIRSLTGLVVLFLSAFILYTINPIFFT